MWKINVEIENICIYNFSLAFSEDLQMRILCVLSPKTNKQHFLYCLFILYLWSGQVSIVKYRPLRDLNIFNQRFIIYKNRLGS